MVACSTVAFGSEGYRCRHANCPHRKYIHQACKSHFCSKSDRRIVVMAAFLRFKAETPACFSQYELLVKGLTL
ncbi:hypothetical protein [Vibrio sp. SG41-7]|uniref:hypothetical protein n=1 Tax=Vibrio sp. SG41-7 TaxID=2760973 RepID=UPI00386AD8D2